MICWLFVLIANFAFFDHIIDNLVDWLRLIEHSSVSMQTQKNRKKQVTLDVNWVDTMTFGCECYVLDCFFRLHTKPVHKTRLLFEIDLFIN